MKSTITTDQYRELLIREARGDFGEEGLGPYFQWLGENWKMVRDIRQGKSEDVTAPKASLLKFVGTVNVPALAEFVARDRFQVDTSDKARVRISYLGDNFKAWFGDKVEETKTVASFLRYHTLMQVSRDTPIIAELGDEANVKTDLAVIFWLMERQKNGQNGALLNNGCANIFYVRDVDGVIQAVYVLWGDGGWNVSAASVEGPFRWDDGLRVFSRNF